MSQKILDIVKPGVVTGEDVQKIFAICKEKKFALPAVNVISTDTINSVLEAAAKVKAPVFIQFSNGGAQFFAGKGLKAEGQQAAILIFLTDQNEQLAGAELVCAFQLRGREGDQASNLGVIYGSL